jgi:hypothetical protein
MYLTTQFWFDYTRYSEVVRLRRYQLAFYIMTVVETVPSHVATVLPPLIPATVLPYSIRKGVGGTPFP